MAVLCIDTSTPLGTVALYRSGDLAAGIEVDVLAEAQWESPQGHGEVLLPKVESVLDRAGLRRDQITRLGVCIGPGGFTAVRVGLATAKGIALGLDKEIVGVQSLRVLARSTPAVVDAVRVSVLNAYRGDIYAAAYRLGDDGRLVEVCPATHGAPADVLKEFATAIGTSTTVVLAGTDNARTAVEDAMVSGWSLASVQPSARGLINEVQQRYEEHGADALQSLEPLYLRPSDAKLPARPLAT